MKKLLGLVALAFIFTLTVPAGAHAQVSSGTSMMADGAFAWGRDGWCYVLSGGQWVRTDYSRSFPFPRNQRVYNLYQGGRFLQRVVENPAPWERVARLARPRGLSTSETASTQTPVPNTVGLPGNQGMDAPPAVQAGGGDQSFPQDLPQGGPQVGPQDPSQGSIPAGGSPAAPGAGMFDGGAPTSMPGGASGGIPGQNMKLARIAAALSLLGQVISPSVR